MSPSRNQPSDCHIVTVLGGTCAQSLTVALQRELANEERGGGHWSTVGFQGLPNAHPRKHGISNAVCLPRQTLFSNADKQCNFPCSHADDSPPACLASILRIDIRVVTLSFLITARVPFGPTLPRRQLLAPCARTLLTRTPLLQQCQLPEHIPRAIFRKLSSAKVPVAGLPLSLQIYFLHQHHTTRTPRRSVHANRRPKSAGGK